MMKNLKIISIFLLSFFYFILFDSLKTDIYGVQEELVTFSFKNSKQIFRAGEEGRFIIQADIKTGWHIYSVLFQDEDAPPPTSIEIEHPFITKALVYETKPIYDFDSVIGLSLLYHKNKAMFYQNIAFPKTILPKEYVIKAKVTYQACSEKICMPPVTKLITSNILIENGAPRNDFLIADRSIDSVIQPRDRFKKLSIHSFLSFLGLAVLMALASLFTPCVFPMIPITISFFSKHSEKSKLKMLGFASLFVAGIAITYTTTGLLLTLIMGIDFIQQFVSSPYTNILISVLFILFGLSLMGLFQFQLPVSFQNYWNQKIENTKGVFSILLMGFLFTITAFTCTVQFIGTLLIAASQGEFFWPIIGMLVFSLVFSLPFFILAFVPHWIQCISKNGYCLTKFKVVAGFIEMMAAIKFLSNADLIWNTSLLTRDIVILIWFFISCMIVVYLLWTAKGSKIQIGFAFIFITFSIWLYSGLNNQSLGSLIDSLLPPPFEAPLEGGEFISKKEYKEQIWEDSLEIGLKRAKKENKLVFLDFTGYTCVNCRWMEQNIFSKKVVHQVFKEKYILVRLYTDGGENKEKNQALQIKRFQTIALPFYVILSANNDVIQSLAGIVYKTDEFVEFLTVLKK